MDRTLDVVLPSKLCEDADRAIWLAAQTHRAHRLDYELKSVQRTAFVTVRGQRAYFNILNRIATIVFGLQFVGI